MNSLINVIKGLFSIILFMLLFISANGEELIKQTNTASISLIVIGTEEKTNNETIEAELIMEEQSSISIEEKYNTQRLQQTNPLTGFAVSREGTKNMEKGLLSILIMLTITLMGLLGYAYKQKKTISY